MKYKLIIPLLSFLLIIAFSGLAKATTYECDSCSSCDTLLSAVAEADDIVLLNQSISSSGGDGCIVNGYNDDGITLDCQGFSITGDPDDIGDGQLGVYANAADMSIVNCVISDYDYAIELDASSITIQNNTIIMCGSGGCGDAGIYGGQTWVNYYYENTILATDDLDGLNYNALIANIGNNSVLRGNTFNATVASDYLFCTTGCSLNWNETTEGNMWLLNNGLGFSQTCIDIDANGICEFPFTISSGNTDYLPIAENVGNSVMECNSYDSCNVAISEVLSLSTVKLTANLTSSSQGIRFINSNVSDSVTFDCDGHSVTGTGMSNVPFQISGTRNSTIQNCYAFASSLSTGLFIATNVEYVTVKDSYINGYYGIQISANTTNALIMDTIIKTDNDGRAMRIQDSSVILISGLILLGETGNLEEGIRIMSSSGIIIESSNIITQGSTYKPVPISIEPTTRNVSIIVTNTTLESDMPLIVVDSSASGYFASGVFYNNILNSTNISETVYFVADGADSLMWNTTKTLGTNIIGGFYLGGNYYTNASGSGFSDTCAEETGDGICDFPYSFSGGTDYLPLTLNSPTPTTIQVTIHEPQNTTYPTGNLDFNATTNATAVAICLSADGNLTFPICSYNTSSLSGFVANVTAGFYNFTFRANNTDGNYDWEMVYFTVEETPTPVITSPMNIFFMIGKLIAGAGFLLFMVILGFMYIPDIKNQTDKIKTLAIFLIGTILGIAVIALL